MHPRIAPCIVVILLAALVGCGDEALPEDPMNDAGTPWWEMDASPMTMPDARVECRSDEHLCDDVCVENYPNEPSYGCALGCGEPCDAPMGGVAICGEDGRCDILCESPNMRVGDECVCQPTTCEEMGRSCGEWDNGCGGTITCGTCADGRACSSAGMCGCQPDVADTDPANNDVRARAPTIASYGDRGGDDETFRIYTVHSDTDVDWYRIEITDETDIAPPYNPRIRISLGAIPAGADYDLGAWYDCASGGGMDLTCEDGEANDLGGDLYGCISARPGAMTERVELMTECDGLDDSGSLLIRVLPRTYTGVCAPYELNFELD